MTSQLPIFLSGKVVKGFGRGGKQLGIPTANFPNEVVDKLPHNVDCGIYFGWAKVNSGPVYKMVMSIGWNPFYKNIKKSVETHILHDFEDDFYDSNLKVGILGYIRPEKNFDSLDDLVAAIKGDIKVAESSLEEHKYVKFMNSDFFNQVSDVMENGSH